MLDERSYLLPRNRVANRWEVELRVSQRELRSALPPRTGAGPTAYDPHLCQITACVVALDQRLLSVARTAISLAYEPNAADSKRLGVRLCGVTTAANGSGGLRAFIEVPFECLDVERGVVLYRPKRNAAPTYAAVEFSRDDFYGDRFDALLLGVDLDVEPGALSAPGELLFFAASGEILDARSLPDFAPLDPAGFDAPPRSVAGRVAPVVGRSVTDVAVGAVRRLFDRPTVRRAVSSITRRFRSGSAPSA